MAFLKFLYLVLLIKFDFLINSLNLFEYLIYIFNFIFYQDFLFLVTSNLVIIFKSKIELFEKINRYCFFINTNVIINKLEL